MIALFGKIIFNQIKKSGESISLDFLCQFDFFTLFCYNICRASKEEAKIKYYLGGLTMKKTFTILGITLLVSMLIMVACGATPYTLTDSQISERLQYRQYTPSNEIVEGNATAIQTINKFLNKEVVVGEDYHKPTVNGVFTYVGNDVCMRYEVTDYSNGEQLLFLYQDDTKVVEAIFSEERYLVGDKLSTSFKKKDSYNGEAFAWTDGKKAVCAIDRNAGPSCTSIWAYNESANEVRLVYCDSFDCPIWYNYYS